VEQKFTTAYSCCLSIISAKNSGEGQLNYFRIFPGWISNSSRFSGVVDFRGLLQMRDKKQSLTAAQHSKFAITLVSDGSSTNGKVG